MGHGRSDVNEKANDWRLTDRLHAPTGKGDPFAAAVRATRMPMLITDPRQPDNPIVFVNDAFLQLTGYARDEVIGYNCRFLQGAETDPSAVAKIRNAVRSKSDVALDIINYKKDRTPFWNALYISPVVDETGDLLFFFASQVDMTSRKEAELRAEQARSDIEHAVRERTRDLEASLAAQRELIHEVDHRVKNNLQLISALILMEMRSTETTREASLEILRERVEALSSVHRRFYRDGGSDRFDIAAFVREFAAEALKSRVGADDGLELDVVPAAVPAALASPIALVASELIRVAITYRQSMNKPIKVKFTIRKLESGYRFCLEGCYGADFVDSVNLNSRRFIDMLARQMQADIQWYDGPTDLYGVCIYIPVDVNEAG